MYLSYVILKFIVLKIWLYITYSNIGMYDMNYNYVTQFVLQNI